MCPTPATKIARIIVNARLLPIDDNYPENVYRTFLFKVVEKPNYLKQSKFFLQ